jgi:ABC-2 type transport system ATP-binding protein
MAIMLSSHLLNQVQSFCDRVGIFAAGQLICVGTVPELARRFGDDSARIEVAFEGLETKGAAERTQRILADLPNVREVVPGARARDPWILVADHDAGTSVREAVLAAAARETLHLTSIREIVPSLDDIYREALYEHGLAGEMLAAESRVA